MAYIEYTGIVPNNSLFWDNPSFKKIIRENKFLVADTDTAEIIDIDGPNPSHRRFRVEDQRTGNHLYVYYDDEAEVNNPSPAFIEILVLMDEYLKENGNYPSRVFFHVSSDDDSDEDMEVSESHRLYNTPYDFSKGCYEGEAPLGN